METPSSKLRRLTPRLAFVALIALGVGVRVWATLRWQVDFDSDEAIIGLMARHIMLGKPIPIYMYGQRYLGSLDAILAAPFLRWLGNSVPALRASQLLSFGLFLSMHGLLMSRLWDKKVALLSMLILALPGWSILLLTSRATFGIMPVLGTLALWLGWRHSPYKAWLRFAHLALLGIIFGLGFWSHPWFVVYMVALGITYGLRTPEWQKLRQRAAGWLNRAPLAISPTLLLIVLVVLAFFSAGCQPQDTFIAIQRLARLALVGIGGIVALALYAASPRRGRLFAASLALALGFSVGDWPQWQSWLRQKIAPTTAIIPSCPTEAPARALFVVKELLPRMIGIPTVASIAQLGPLPAVLWLVALGLALAALGYFIHSQRHALWALFSLSPPTREDMRGIVIAVLFGLPLLFAMLASNVHSPAHVRYLLLTWQASSAILALFFSWLWERSRILGILCLSFWVGQVGLRNLQVIEAKWQASRDCHSPQAIAALEGYLTEREVRGGYADYWLAYSLDFLTEERLILAPYNSDRYPPYAEQVARLPVQAWLFRPNVIPAESERIEDLAQAVAEAKPVSWMCYPEEAGPAAPWIRERLRKQSVIERRFVGDWDVWLLSNTPTLPQSYEAEAAPRQAGQVVSDASASGGEAVRAAVGEEAAGLVAFGPYEIYCQGQYQACFLLRVGPAPADAVVAVVDVATDLGNRILARRDVVASELAAEGYSEACVAFAQADCSPLEFRVYWTAAADLWYDRVQISR